MHEKVVPMIHVPNVNATADWYSSIGFKLVRYNKENAEINWALLSFGNSELMFNAGGQPSTEHRREVDLYVHTDNIDDVYKRLKDRVQVVDAPHVTFYAMREFTIRDLNGFWVSFGQPVSV